MYIIIAIAICMLIPIIYYYYYNNHYCETFVNVNLPDDMFPDLYYINLKHRTDRKKHILEQLSMINYPKTKIHRINATKNIDGATGCGLSHIKALTLAKNTQHKQDYIIILEDDYKWIYDMDKTMDILTNVFNQKVDWNVILLSCNGYADKYNDYLDKVSSCQTTSGYIIKTNYIDTLIKLWDKDMKYRLQHHINSKSKEYTPTCIDQSWKKLQHDKWFITNPKLGLQIDSYSDIEGGNVNYMV